MSSLTSLFHRGPAAAANRDMWEWSARIEAKPELGSSFTVIIFLGAVPNDPKEWLVSPNMVGSHAIMDFSAGHGGYGGGRGGGGDQAQEGFVHLNQAIAERSGLSSLEPEVVVPYLKENIQWRVQKMDFDTEPVEVPSLEVAVLATPLTFPPGSMFPVPGQPRRYNQITYGRPGGSRNP